MGHLVTFIIISALNKNVMLLCIHVLSRMMTEFGVFLDKQILYNCNMANKVKSRFFDAHKRR